MKRLLIFLLPLATLGGLAWHFWLVIESESRRLWQLLKDQADPIQSLEASAALLVLLAGAVWRILRVPKEPPPVASTLQAKAEGSIVGGNVQAKEFVGRDKTTLNIANLQIQYGTYQGEPPRSDSHLQRGAGKPLRRYSVGQPGSRC